MRLPGRKIDPMSQRPYLDSQNRLQGIGFGTSIENVKDRN
jgi:hypothetical protein